MDCERIKTLNNQRSSSHDGCIIGVPQLVWRQDNQFYVVDEREDSQPVGDYGEWLTLGHSLSAGDVSH